MYKNWQETKMKIDFLMGLDVSVERPHRDDYRWENEHVHGNRCLPSIRLSGLLQHDCVEADYLAGVAQAIADGVWGTGRHRTTSAGNCKRR